MEILVGIGGMFGAIMRFYIGKFIASRTASDFSYATFLINISGCILLGILMNLYRSKDISTTIWMLLGVGFLGAYTTFSTFGYETIGFIEKKLYIQGGVYVLLSITLGIFGAWVGMNIS
ncbi:fluoride efflux transporter CrcB [Lutibacter sp. B2]|nr:fluoride efflux transporter CrcB [Lutibacter sp. B2]